jgi:putative membrane protein
MMGDGGQQMSGGMMSMMVLGWIFLLALTVLIIVATIWLIRSSRPQKQRPVTSQALAQLDLRYVRGEVEREEFLRRKGDLSEDG